MGRFLHGTATLLGMVTLFGSFTSNLCAYGLIKDDRVPGKTIKWNTDNITYYVNPSGSGVSSEETIAAVRAAFDTWSTALNGAITFTYMGTTTSKHSQEDHKVVVFWDADGTVVNNALGITVPTFDSRDGTMVDADIAFATTVGSSVLYAPPGSGCSSTAGVHFGGIPIVWNIGRQGLSGLPLFSVYNADIQATATHEIGHLLGLVHSTVQNAAMSTMIDATPAFFCNTDQRILKDDDIAGATSLYPGHAPTCSLSASPSTITAGQAVNLTWSTTGSPTSRSIDNGVGAVLGSGSATVWPIVSTTYTLTVINTSGSGTCSDRVTVTQPPEVGVLYDSSFIGTSYDVTTTAGYGLALRFPFYSGTEYPYAYQPYPGASSYLTLTAPIRYLRVKRLSGVACNVPSNVFLGTENAQILGHVGTGVAMGEFCDFPVSGTAAGNRLSGIGFCVNAACDASNGTMVLDGSPINTGAGWDIRGRNRQRGGWAVQLCGGGGCSGGFASAPQPMWIQKAPTTAPPNAVVPGLTFDATRGQVVLLHNNGDIDMGTWVWDGTNWTQKHPVNSPPPRSLFAMAFDTIRSQVVMFGGNSKTGEDLNDTWVWDGTNWTQKHPVNSPPPHRYAIAFDSVRGQVVMFGTDGYSTSYFNDTWVWDGTNWTQKHPVNSPPPGARPYEVAMSFDAVRGQIVLFRQSDFSIGTETWVWDGTNWTQKHPVNNPSARIRFAMAFDAFRGQVVMVGGVSLPLNGFSLLDDTWVWDGTNWTQKHPVNSPSARMDSAMAFDSVRGQVVLFGGFDYTYTRLNDTWVW